MQGVHVYELVTGKAGGKLVSALKPLYNAKVRTHPVLLLPSLIRIRYLLLLLQLAGRISSSASRSSTCAS
jgi:predicted membrane protein